MSIRTRRFLPHFHMQLCVELVFSERRHGAYCLEAIRLKVRGGGYTAPQSLDAGGRSPPSLLASARLIHFFYNLTHLQLAPFLHSSSLPLTKKRSKLSLYIHLSSHSFSHHFYTQLAPFCNQTQHKTQKKEQAALFHFLLFTLLFPPLTHT